MIHWGGLTLTKGESDFYSSPVNFCEIQQSTWREGFGTGYTSNYVTVNYTKLQIFHASGLFPIIFDDWSGPWLIPHFVLLIFQFWDWQVVADLCLVRGNPGFMLILGLPLIVDVVSLFASASVWIFYFVQSWSFSDDFRILIILLVFLNYQSSFLLDFRLPVGNSRLPFILPSGLQTTSWGL